MPKAYNVQDKYFQKAKQQGYRARSAFKLLEINDKFKILSNAKSVLDLGSAPGSWLQVLKQENGRTEEHKNKRTNEQKSRRAEELKKGLSLPENKASLYGRRDNTKLNEQKNNIVGIDLEEIKPVKGVKFYQADITDLEKLGELLGDHKFDLITADLAPKTSGIKDVDQYRSVELNISVLELAKKFLSPKGKVITKVFVGEDFAELVKEYKSFFREVKNFKPAACRARSFETYLICWK